MQLRPTERPHSSSDRPQHFELVSESDLTTAQSSLLSEIQPEVASLLQRVDAHLDKLARREQSLIAKAELQEGRLSQPSSRQSMSKSPATQRSAGGSSGLEEMKLQTMRQKKKRLSYAVGRLELQASQRERQLRKSMAAQ